MKIKTSELSGVALDWAVAQAAGVEVKLLKHSTGYCAYADYLGEVLFDPSEDWVIGGPLIEQFRIHCDMMIYDDIVRYWEANLPDQPTYEIGDTPLQAACRAIVAAKLGDDVDVPEGLV